MKYVRITGSVMTQTENGTLADPATHKSSIPESPTACCLTLSHAQTSLQLSLDPSSVALASVTL